MDKFVVVVIMMFLCVLWGLSGFYLGINFPDTFDFGRCALFKEAREPENYIIVSGYDSLFDKNGLSKVGTGTAFSSSTNYNAVKSIASYTYDFNAILNKESCKLIEDNNLDIVYNCKKGV